MQEIERFFGDLLRSIFNRIRYKVRDVAERKVQETIDGQFNQQQQKRQEQEDLQE